MSYGKRENNISEEEKRSNPNKTPPPAQRERTWALWISLCVAVLASVGALLVYLFPGRSSQEILPETVPEMITVWVQEEKIIYDSSDEEIGRQTGSYDEYGYPIDWVYVRNGEKDSRTTWTFDKKGNLVETVEYSGQTIRIVTLAYDNRDNLIERKTHQNDSNSRTTYAYDLQGNQTEQVSYDGDRERSRNTYVYNKQGQQVEHIYSEYGKEQFRCVYTYDSQGKQTAYIEYRDGVEFSRTTRTYDEQGNLTEETYDDGQTNSRTTYTYNANGKQLEIVMYANGEEHSRFTNAYDDQGNLVEELRYYKGTLEYRRAFTYDAQGNRTMTTERYDGPGRTVATYDKEGNFLEEISYDVTGAESTRHVATYDAQGRQIEITRYVYGEEAHRFVYAYDEMGNQIEQTEYVDGVQYRRYTYSWKEMEIPREQAEKIYTKLLFNQDWCAVVAAYSFPDAFLSEKNSTATELHGDLVAEPISFPVRISADR